MLADKIELYEQVKVGKSWKNLEKVNWVFFLFSFINCILIKFKYIS